MKNTIMIVAFGFIGTIANAQKIKETDVPAPVKAVFAKQYPSAKAKQWEKEKANYEVAFDFNKVEMSLLIDEKGDVMETETEIKASELSKTIVDYCEKNYVGKKIAEASKIVDSKGVVTYEAEINKVDLLFDADGKFIKELMD